MFFFVVIFQNYFSDTMGAMKVNVKSFGEKQKHMISLELKREIIKKNVIKTYE